jgi:hypothetical protein
MYYLVMAMTKTPPPQSGVLAGYDQQGNPIYSQAQPQVSWEVAGVFEAETAEQACKAAAKKSQRFGSFFAVEGFPWGIDLIETDATEFGVEQQEISRLRQLEVRSREMERQAGID